MGDFLLDCRRKGDRFSDKAADFLRFYSDMRVDRFEYPEFDLVVSSADKDNLWGPYRTPGGEVLVALSGRIAVEQQHWNQASKVQGSGGLACKCISKAYLEGGEKAVENLSGNFVVLIYDRAANKLLIITDRWGLFPAFKLEGDAADAVYASHPDVLADAVGEGRNWDLTSFAEFILAGKVSAPFTYYRAIKALPVGSTTTLSFGLNRKPSRHTVGYFQFEADPRPEQKMESLAEQFCAGVKLAVTKRTLPILGRSAVALSGGLDSRTILCATPNQKELVTFSCYDEENREFQIARSIARAVGAEFIPLKRNFDYYGESAALGVKISAGMGCIASNHFLGFRDKLRELGVDNFLTGCYCDYLFKGLALNRRVNSWTTRESLAPFDFSYYSRHFHTTTELGAAVRSRLEGLFPPDLRRYDNEPAVFRTEMRRIFPLCYEEDNAERTIPQRVMGWYVPIAENALMDVLLSMSSSMKLNRRLFAQMVGKVCPPAIAAIPDANTGAPVNSSPFREAFNSHLRTVEKLYGKLRPSNATTGSWLNWTFYARQSQVIQALWSVPNPAATEIFQLVLGKDGFSENLSSYTDRRVYLFLQLFTLKIWLDQRCSCS
jgi:asparagine synthase (glutamine-hydrolysing)